MKILMINSVCGIRSTGRICTDLAQELEKQGHIVKIAYGREYVPEEFQKYAVRIGNDFDVKMHGVRARVFDEMGFGSKRATKKFVDWINQYNPDLIHLHNIHGYYINIGVLFEYLKNCGKKIVWTLHDCWAFTGHCTYFDYIHCYKWKTGCMQCKQKHEYPSRLLIDNSLKNYKRKRRIFSNIPELILVTPSFWLKNLVKDSYLKNYPLEVIHNGVNTDVFKPVASNLREKYRLHGKKIVLGVASVWDKRKGLDTFIKLSSRLDKSYQIILVGLKKRQREQIPSNIICIERTNSARMLSEIYSAADVFVNPTLEDNYPTTNLEAIACGTPVITYETGGSAESAEMYGKVVARGDIEKLIQSIIEISNIKKNIISVDYRDTIDEYIKLYSM